MICIKILGQGKQGIAFLTDNNRVIKIQSAKYKEINCGDYFGINIASKLKPYFTQIYSVKFVDKNCLDKIICKDKSTINIKEVDNYPYYKISTMEFAGETISINKWTNENCLNCFNNLLNPILKMNSMGYFHNDLHFKNVTLHNNIFKIIDYDLMNKNKSTNDINGLVAFLIPSLSLIWWRPKYDNYLNDYNSKKTIEKLKKYYDGPNKYEKNKYLFTYMGLYHPELYFNVLLHNKTSDGNIPIDIKRKLFKSEKIMQLIYLINTTFKPKKNNFMNLLTDITNILQ